MYVDAILKNISQSQRAGIMSILFTPISLDLSTNNMCSTSIYWKINDSDYIQIEFQPNINIYSIFYN